MCTRNRFGTMMTMMVGLGLAAGCAGQVGESAEEPIDEASASSALTEETLAAEENATDERLGTTSGALDEEGQPIDDEPLAQDGETGTSSDPIRVGWGGAGWGGGWGRPGWGGGWGRPGWGGGWGRPGWGGGWGRPGWGWGGGRPGWGWGGGWGRPGWGGACPYGRCW